MTVFQTDGTSSSLVTRSKLTNMDKEQLLNLLQEFVDLQDNFDKDAWYATDHVIYGYVINKLAKHLGLEADIKITWR